MFKDIGAPFRDTLLDFNVLDSIVEKFILFGFFAIVSKLLGI